MTAAPKTSCITPPAEENGEFDPTDYPPEFQPWMVGRVAPELFGKGKIRVSDEEFMKPIEAAT
ncbi:hypothetical protein LJC47_04510 [Desulfosarcina sp. OttesenSCG-928-B08]|nr:hypothetical protein [Desulfosarcina sp. OttesenSCG-928-B08]